MVPLLEPHHVGRFSASGNCCVRPIHHCVVIAQTGQRLGPSVFVVRVVASLTTVFSPPMLFFIAVASKCFGLISFKNRRKKKKGAAVMKRCVCAVPLLSSTLKFGTGVQGSLSPSTSSSRSESISKVTFCLEGRLLASSLAGEAHLRFTDFK